MLTGAKEELGEQEFTCSKQAWHVHSLEIVDLAVKGGPRVPQPMHKGQAETRAEVRTWKSLIMGTEAAMALEEVTVVGSVPPFCGSDANAGEMAVVDRHSGTESGTEEPSFVGANDSSLGAPKEDKPFTDVT